MGWNQLTSTTPQAVETTLTLVGHCGAGSKDVRTYTEQWEYTEVRSGGRVTVLETIIMTRMTTTGRSVS